MSYSIVALERKIVDFKLNCKRCGEIKPASEFYNRRDSLCGKTSWCIKCVRERNKNRNEILSDNHPLIANGKRKCRVCNTEKPLADFGRTKEGKFGRAYRCKPCRVRLEKERLNNPRKGKYKTDIPRHFKRYADPYGLTMEDKIKMLQSQNGLCANKGCGKQLSLERKAKNVACVDHCHSSGKIRGLLCRGCNVALGFLEEDRNRILRLSEYLQTYKE